MCKDIRWPDGHGGERKPQQTDTQAKAAQSHGHSQQTGDGCSHWNQVLKASLCHADIRDNDP